MNIVNYEKVEIVEGHNLSSVFENSSFDFVFSTFVFEHLLMPWKVALEINKILRVGGSLRVQSHQNLGLHDLPWDYRRFSSESWTSLLNKIIGFEIVDNISDHQMYIIHFLTRDEKFDAEKAAGYELSAVHAVKVCHRKSVAAFPIMFHLNIGTEIMTRIIVSQH